VALYVVRCFTALPPVSTFFLGVRHPLPYFVVQSECMEDSRPSPYLEGMFRVQVRLEANYPQSAPKVRFYRSFFLWVTHLILDPPELSLCRRSSSSLSAGILISTLMMARCGAGVRGREEGRKEGRKESQTCSPPSCIAHFVLFPIE
jgi:hypothetical protein